MPAASASASAREQAAARPVRSGRTAGRTGRATTQRARHDERDRHDVGDPAHEEAQGVAVRPSPTWPPSHAEVDDEGEEDAERDEPEADQVEVALLEPRRPRPAAAGTGRRATRGRRLLGRRRDVRLAGLAVVRRVAIEVPAAPSTPARAAPAGSAHRPSKNVAKARRGRPVRPRTIEAMEDFARPPRVLVVEDDERDRAGPAALAAPGGLRGAHRRRRRRGARRARTTFLPDLVILDLGLPQARRHRRGRAPARRATTRRS